MQKLTLLEDPTLFPPHPGAQESFLDDYAHRYVAFAAGWGAGKTWAGARKLVNLHLLNAFDSAGHLTGVKGLAIAPTYQIASSVLVPELRRAMEEAQLNHCFVSDPRRFCFFLPDLSSQSRPSEILIRSAERPDLITGFQVGHLWGDEAGRWRNYNNDPTDDPMLQAEGRLRDPNAIFLQANYTFTHEGDCTRIFRRFEEECAGRPDYALYRGTTEENPLMRDYAHEKRLALSPELAAQYLDGKAICRRGAAIYSSFDESRNVDPTLNLAPDLPLHLSIDFNIDPGMHSVIGQHLNGSGLLTAVHEIHQPRMNLRQMFLALRDLLESQYGGWHWPALWIFGDATGAGKWAGSGESCWDIVTAAMQNAGLPYRLMVPRSNPPIADRVNVFNCALHALDGQTRYKIHPRCKRLIRDLKQMRWTNGEVDKSDRRLSHASDAEGYRVHWIMPIRPLRLQGHPRSTVGFSP